MNKVIEDKIVIEDDKAKVKSHGDVQSKTSVKADEVKFWSSISNYMIATAGRNIQFSNHVFCPKTGDHDEEIVRQTNTPYVYEVVDKPFEDEAKLARFNSFLSDILFTGERGEPSRRGIIAIQALFSAHECDDLVAGGKTKADQLIVRVMRTKSFKGGI